MTIRRERYLIENDCIKLMLENDVWQKLSYSKELPWSEALIDKYINKWDWIEISDNKSIEWTEDMLEKFSDRIDWETLSGSIAVFRLFAIRSIPWDIIKKFEAKWNWKLLSKHGCQITPEVIDMFIDKWDWGELIDNIYVKWDYKLYETYKRYISTTDFNYYKQTELWRKLVQIEERIITAKIFVEVSMSQN